MKKINVLLTLTAACLFVTALPALTFAQGGGFTSPRKGDTIENRKAFMVSLQINDFDKSGHYWVAIATVTGHDSTWKRVLELYKESRNGNRAARSKIKALIGEWQIDQFWPKFYVSKSPYEDVVYDGGINPLRGLEPQPMILLILKVDDPLTDFFKKWFKEGPKKGYPGIGASELGRGMVIARCEIFFP